MMAPARADGPPSDEHAVPVARDVEKGPPVFAFASRRYPEIASITESGTCVPPGPSKKARLPPRAENRRLTAATSKATVLMTVTLT